jgi:hypothetical protein
LDDWFTAANLNSTVARPGHQATVTTVTLLAGKVCRRLLEQLVIEKTLSTWV